MRSIRTIWVISTLLTILPSSLVGAEPPAKLVSSKMIWDQAPRNVSSDITRFKNRWFVVCRESTNEYSQDGAVRILTSKDGEKWESATLIQSPTPNKSLSNPKITVTPDNQLMVSALGIVANLNATDPLPEFGGTVTTIAWYSKDGTTWSKPDYIGTENYPFGRIVWHKGVAYSYANGCICGSMQTIRVYANKEEKGFQEEYERTFSKFFPEEASIVFDADNAYCILSRYSAEIGNAIQTGYLGIAKAPYKQWEWKELDRAISDPNLIRLPDGRIIGAFGLHDKKSRTCISEFDPTTGKIKELLELPTKGKLIDVGVYYHDKHLWISYHALHQGKSSIHLAKVKLKDTSS